ncbi:amidohydrolase family protein [Curtobacterium sp. RRHDQ10]|uniref:amidohydrolase family protein n=1 Tax=Curtobacterium phyllosphaerae TaxID=3413379 RepID=UPI003BF003BD
MIIDAHHHLWDPAVRSYPWMTDEVAAIRRRFALDDLVAAITGTGVEETVVVQAVHDVDETAELLAVAAGRGPVVGVVGWVDLTAPDVADVLAQLQATGPLVGIRHQAQDEPDAGWLARPEVVRGVSAVAAAGLPFDLLVRRRETDAALALVDALPAATFVLDHAGKPEIVDDAGTGGPVAAEWRARMRMFAARPNVVGKVSGLLTEGGPDWRERPVTRYVRELVEILGPERSMFGSDWPVSTLAAPYGEVVAVTAGALDDLSDAEGGAVLHETATRVYRLD